MSDAKARWRPTLRLSIGVVLTMMILVTATVLTVMSYWSSRSALLTFARDLMAKNADMAQMQIDAGDQEARRSVEMMRSLVRDGTIRADDFRSMERCFFSDLTIHDDSTGLVYGNEKGESLMVQHQPDGSLATRTVTGEGAARRVVWRYRAPGAVCSDVLREQADNNDAFDPRIRPWYLQAKKAGRLCWTDVYVFHSTKEPGMSAAAPCVDPEGRFCGVVSIDISLTALSEFLARKVRVGNSGWALLLGAGGEIVATSQAEDLVVSDGKGKLRLRRLAESAHPQFAALGAVPEAAARFAGDPADGDPQPAHAPDELIRYRADGVDYVAYLRNVSDEEGGWCLGVVAAEDECIAEAKRASVRSALTAVGLTVLAILVGGLVAQRIARSLRLLSQETGRLEQLDFAEGGRLSSRFLEVHQALSAFQRMRTGLRAFGKYVPTTLVRALLRERVEPMLGGDTKEVTLLFSDIRDFTTTSERMPPTEVADKLGRYLSAVTDCIHEHHGTVDKYSGDGVMAFWNAPTVVADHPLEACRAAIECMDRIAALQTELGGGMDLYTRIGIHTASVIVGNFGSTDRLNYTAMGDGVNLASRLEGVNKLFGTQVLISEDTYECVRDRLEARQVGLVSVKGRVGACAVYELLGEKGQVDERRLRWARRYEEAWAHYRSRRWDEAIGLLEALQAETPDDLSIRFLTRACRHCRDDEPPQDWLGAFSLTTK